MKRGAVATALLVLATATACGKVGPPVRRAPQPPPAAAAEPLEENEEEERRP